MRRKVKKLKYGYQNEKKIVSGQTAKVQRGYSEKGSPKKYVVHWLGYGFWLLNIYAWAIGT